MKKPPCKQHIADLALLLKRFGVRHAVICPGSRNAPLIHVFHRDKDFSCYSIIDERSAGYVALGIARQSCSAVAVVTTSGTAALNLAPAIAEAYYQQIPLVVLTADRPPEWPPQFSNQRINQEDIFKPNVKGSYNLPPEPVSLDDAGQVIRQVSDILGTALSIPQGPVHLNVPLDEPLYETVADASKTARLMQIKVKPPKRERSLKRTEDLPETGSQPEVSGSPRGEIIHSKPSRSHPAAKPLADTRSGKLSDAEAAIISTALNNRKKVLLIAGMNVYSTEERELLSSLTEQYQAVVIAENITNLNRKAAAPLRSEPATDPAPPHPEPLNTAAGDYFISLPELVLASAGEVELNNLTPDLVIVFGLQVVSKRTRLFVQHLENVPVISSNFLPAIPTQESPSTNHFLTAWKKQETTALQRATTFLSTAGFSNLTATAAILSQVPPDTTVHLGNSGTIRYSQLASIRTDLTCHSNRGTSGIDGSLSAAVGAAMVSPGPHLAILGDLGFVYDSNALWNKNFPNSLKIIVLNDQGGGIFRLLDGPSRMPFFEEFSVTSHPVSLQHLTEAFGLKHLYASDMTGLINALATLFSGDTGPALLEVNTSKSENSAIFKQFFKSLQNT